MHHRRRCSFSLTATESSVWFSFFPWLPQTDLNHIPETSASVWPLQPLSGPPNHPSRQKPRAVCSRPFLELLEWERLSKSYISLYMSVETKASRNQVDWSKIKKPKGLASWHGWHFNQRCWLWKCMFAQMGLFIFTSGLTMVTLFPITSSTGVVQDVAAHQLRSVAVYKGLFKQPSVKECVEVVSGPFLLRLQRWRKWKVVGKLYSKIVCSGQIKVNFQFLGQFCAPNVKTNNCCQLTLQNNKKSGVGLGGWSPECFYYHVLYESLWGRSHFRSFACINWLF